MNDKKSKFFNVVNRQFEIYEKKNRDYGDSFNITLNKFGSISFVTRLADKYLRLEQLVKEMAMVADESFDDTVSDMVNYGIMYLMWKEEERSKTNADSG